MTLIMGVLRALIEAVEQVERLIETEVSLKIGNMKKKKQCIFFMLQSCLQMDMLYCHQFPVAGV